MQVPLEPLTAQRDGILIRPKKSPSIEGLFLCLKTELNSSGLLTLDGRIDHATRAGVIIKRRFNDPLKLFRAQVAHGYKARAGRLG